MKAIIEEKEITGYNLRITIEKEGEEYNAYVYWDNYDGYDVRFVGKNWLERIPTPEWVAELVEELDQPLGYTLELLAEETEKEGANV